MSKLEDNKVSLSPVSVQPSAARTRLPLVYITWDGGGVELVPVLSRLTLCSVKMG